MTNDKQPTDTIARVTARDLFLILRTFEQTPESTMENVRLRLCHDRKIQRRGTFLWSTARDILGELDRLGYVKDVPSPKTSRHFETTAAQPVHITDDGRTLLGSFGEDKAKAYDALFCRMYERHPYLQAFVSALKTGPLFAPVISSMKEHVSVRYTSATLLADDVTEGTFDVDAFLQRVADRSGAPLSDEQRREIRKGVAELLKDASLGATRDELPKFAKTFMERLNHVVLPALFRAEGMAFDYRTHRTLWTLGEEFRVWCVTRSHPDHDGYLVYPTANIELTPDGAAVAKLSFDTGLSYVKDGFLRRLFDAFQKLQGKRGTTFVTAWELRSIFCVDNRCQRSTFDRVFAENCNYRGDDEYQLQLEIQRTKPQHEEPLRAGDRNIGSVRVVKL